MAPPRLTRRGALGAGALALASCGGGDPAPAGKPRAGSGAGLLNSLVALEQASVAAWAAIAAELQGEARRRARAIRAREAEHVERVSALVRDLGGAPPAPRPARDYRQMFPAMSGAADALRFAGDLEERLVRAYLDALRSLPQAEQRHAAATIAAEEAADLAVVHVLAGEPAAPEPFVTGTS
jgi:hypothetical protein